MWKWELGIRSERLWGEPLRRKSWECNPLIQCWWEQQQQKSLRLFLNGFTIQIIYKIQFSVSSKHMSKCLALSFFLFPSGCTYMPSNPYLLEMLTKSSESHSQLCSLELPTGKLIAWPWMPKIIAEDRNIKLSSPNPAVLPADAALKIDEGAVVFLSFLVISAF